MTCRDRQIVPSADEIRLNGPSSAGDGKADGGAAAWAGLDRQLGADQEGALSHAADAEAALGLVEGEAAAIVADLEEDIAALGPAQAHLDVPGGAMAGGVGERLLGDPIDDELGVAAEIRKVAVDHETGLDLAAEPPDLSFD